MNTTPATAAPAAEEVTFEIVPADAQLPAEEKQSLIQTFSPLLARAKELLNESAGITSAKLARVSRLQFRKLRSESNELRESTNAHHLRMQRAVNGAHAILVAAVQGEEERMEGIEKAELRAEEARIEAIRQERHDQLVTLGVHESIVNSPGLGRMANDAFMGLLADSKALHEARVKREQEEADAKLKRELEEAQQRERDRAENLRLLKEAEEKEAAAKLEREKAAAEKKALEDKLAAERAESERKAEYERKMAQAQQDEIEAKAKREREALEAKHKAAQAAAAKKAADEKAAADKKLAEEKAAREKLEQAEADRLAAEAKKKADDEAAAEAALLAPDKDKLIKIANMLRHMPPPQMKSKKGNSIASSIAVKLTNLADWIEEKAEEL